MKGFAVNIYVADIFANDLLNYLKSESDTNKEYWQGLIIECILIMARMDTLPKA